MQGKGIYVILLGIIAVLTLSVAVLSIFLFVMFNHPAPGGVQDLAQAEETAEPEIRLVPAEEQRSWNPFATGDNPNAPGLYNLMPSEGRESSFLQVTLLIKYDVGENRELEALHSELVETFSAAEIRQACAMYFRRLTYEEVKAAEAIPQAQDALKEAFNRIIDENAGEPLGIIRKVVIENMLPQ